MSVSKNAIGVMIGKYLLGLCVVCLIFAIGFSQVTEYNTLKPVVNEFTKKFLEGNPGNGPNQTIGQQLYTGIMQECMSKERVEYPFINEKLVLDCKGVKTGGISAISESVTQLMLKDYYKKYDCTPLGCILDIFAGKQGNFTYIYSEQMNSFLKMVIPFLIAGILAGVILIYFSTKDIFLFLDNLGKTLLKSGIPFLILMILIYRDQLLVTTGILSGKENFMRSADDFFSGPIYQIMNLFLYLYGAVFIIGITCIAIGFAGIKFYKRSSYNKYIAGQQPQIPLMGGKASRIQTGMKIPDASGNLLNHMLENEYKELLFATEELPGAEKISKIKEKLNKKKDEMRMQDQMMASANTGNTGNEMILSSNEKFIAILEGLLEDINSHEKDGKSAEEIIKHIRQVMLGSNKVST